MANRGELFREAAEKNKIVDDLKVNLDALKVSNVTMVSFTGTEVGIIASIRGANATGIAADVIKTIEAEITTTESEIETIIKQLTSMKD